MKPLTKEKLVSEIRNQLFLICLNLRWKAWLTVAFSTIFLYNLYVMIRSGIHCLLTCYYSGEVLGELVK